MKRFSELLTPGSFLHEILYVGFIIFFCFFYTAIVFNPDNVSDNMKKYGGFIPGIRPGKKTTAYCNAFSCWFIPTPRPMPAWSMNTPSKPWAKFRWGR